MMRKISGFTLAEVLITVVVLAVLAGLAMPNYFRTVEQSRTNEAVANLNIIRMGERIYKLNNGRYWPNPDATNGTLSDINTNLNIDLDTKFYTTITVTTSGSGTAFSAVATRNTVSGGDGVSTKTIDQTGTIT